MNRLPFERLFTMGAFDGLRSVRKQAMETVGVDRARLVEIIREIDSDAGGLDYEAALELDAIVVADAPLDNPHEFYRCCIASAILEHRMSWGRVIKLGRQKLLALVSRDAHHCFRAARLLDSPPAADVVRWWDALDGQMRFVYDQQKREESRRAERLSLEYEFARLAQLGVDRSPYWVALDDNTAGYDILSYEPGDPEPVNLLIEVKSTTASPLRFYVTRNEWDHALEYGDAYEFHLWDLRPTPPRLHRRSSQQVRAHIPTDNKDGKWWNAEIPLAADANS